MPSPEWRGLGWGYAALIREKKIMIWFPRRLLLGDSVNGRNLPLTGASPPPRIARRCIYLLFHL